MVETSLRERSRVRRRAAIERAALKLFAERGYETTTIADIAAAADVAPRTVPLYFPTKLDLALAYSDDAARRMIALLEESGEDERQIEALMRFVKHELFEESEILALHRAMLETNIALRGLRSAVGAESYQIARTKLARELGRDVDDVVVTLVGAAVEGVIRQLLELDPVSHDLDATFDVAVGILESSLRAAREDESVG
jgi:AcrR family transcriptional regulator